MKWMPLPRKKERVPAQASAADAGSPVKDPPAHGAQLSERKKKGLAIHIEPQDPILQAIKDAPGPVPQPPHNASTLSLASGLSVRERRSSSRSLELLRNMTEQGQTNVWESLPPSPSIMRPDLMRRINQWGLEAGSRSEHKQRERLVQLMLRAEQNQSVQLVIDNAEHVMDLPPCLGDMDHLQELRFDNLPQVAQLLDLSGLSQLSQIYVKDCPRLRLHVPAQCEVMVFGADGKQMTRSWRSGFDRLRR